MITRKFLSLAFFIALTPVANAQKAYEYTVDLTKVVHDRVQVQLSPPKITSAEVVFYLPKIIPGTYAVADYGRLVTNVKAFDKSGKELAVEKVDVNGWKIKNATKLNKLSYWVDDTFDTQLEGPQVFWPAGTNIDEGENFIINPSGFFGYFENFKDLQYKFNIIRPKELYGSTGLIPIKQGEALTSLKREEPKPDPEVRVDLFSTEDYDRLIDSPLMYSKPDTAIIHVANTEVLISSYSPNGKITAKEIAQSIREILMAQREFLGGELPVDKYAFLFYWTDKPVTSYGALEHSYSSVYYMPEATIDKIEAQVKDFAAHEFFHIVTPLTIHSEEIHRFGFNQPSMSRHLWLYEGVTEYFAGSVQVKYGLISREEYIDRMRQKMLTADNFINDVPFTEISSLTLEKYSNQFYNVYMKGALIGMCLDIKLRSLSNGQYGLQNLVADLGKRFGKSRPFKDEELFDEITGLTYPEVGEFLSRYVGGPERLPFSDIFSLVGIDYQPYSTQQELTLGFENGSIGVGQHDGKNVLIISNTAKLNEQGQLCSFEQGDILWSINGEPVPELGPELGAYFEKHGNNLKEGEKLVYVVKRKSENGELKEVELTSVVRNVERRTNHVLRLNEEATADQLKIREAWLRP